MDLFQGICGGEIRMSIASVSPFHYGCRDRRPFWTINPLKYLVALKPSAHSFTAIPCGFILQCHEGLGVGLFRLLQLETQGLRRKTEYHSLKTRPRSFISRGGRPDKSDYNDAAWKEAHVPARYFH